MKYITRTIKETHVKGIAVFKDSDKISQLDFEHVMYGDYTAEELEQQMNKNSNDGTKYFVTGIEVKQIKRRMTMDAFVELSELVENETENEE